MTTVLRHFNQGVWRIPNDEIDRPGSFASHMSRCVTLLMQILKETDDSRMLMELCVQLRKTPDADKKYVRDSEREQLSRQALTLCLQSLRTRVQTMGPPNAADNALLFRTDPRTRILLDVYKIYQQVQKNFQGKEVQAFATLLVDTYKAYMGIKNAEGNLLEAAMRCCQQQNLANKIAASQSHQSPSVQVVSPTVTSTPAASVTQSQPTSTSPQAQPHRKPYKNPGTGRPRGRPPNVNKYLQNLQQSGNLMNQFNAKRGFGNFMNAASPQSLMNPFFINPLMDQNMISAMLATGLGGNMLDPLSTVNYLNHMGYQELFRQYQNNIAPLNNLGAYPPNISTSMSNVSSMPTISATNVGMSGVPTSSMNNIGAMGNLSNLTVQQLLNLNKSTTASTTVSSSAMHHQPTSKIATTTSSTVKDVSHSVSITPVGVHHKSKTSKHGTSTNSDSMSTHSLKSMQAPQQIKSVSHTPMTQVSLLKPSVIQQTKTTAPTQISSQMRSSKNLNELQPAHTSSLSVSPLKSGNSSNMMNLSSVSHPSIQNQGINIQPVPMGMPSRSGTSLQHKLQLKKQAQHIPPPKVSTQSPIKKHRSTMKQSLPPISNNLQSILNMNTNVPMSSTASYLPSELSVLSVSAVNQSMNSMMSQMKNITFRKGVNKSKVSSMEIPTPIKSPLPQPSSSETLNMLSQLQQHAHLEIIPQSKNHSKQNADYSKNIPLSLSVVPQKTIDSARPLSSDTMAVFEVPRSKTNNSPKKVDKQVKDSVEIITLDD